MQRGGKLGTGLGIALVKQQRAFQHVAPGGSRERLVMCADEGVVVHG